MAEQQRKCHRPPVAAKPAREACKCERPVPLRLGVCCTFSREAAAFRLPNAVTGL